MKDLMKMMMALVACAVMFASCGDTTNVAAPTDLAVTNVTQTGATLIWDGVETTFEVTINGETEVITGKTLVVDGLTAGTNYTWEVRAMKDVEYSKSVEGPAFTTLAAPTTGITVNFGGETWSATSMFGQETDEGDYWLAYIFANDDPEAYPYTQVWPAPALGNDITLDPAVDEMFFNYATSADLHLQDQTTGQVFGDWMLRSGSYDLTAYSLDGISASFDMIMFDAFDQYVGHSGTPNASPEEKPLTIDIINTPLSAMPSAKAFEMTRKAFNAENLTAVK